MTAIDFPNTPQVGDTLTVGDTTWEWTGTVWDGFAVPVPGPQGDTGPTGPAGPAGPGLVSGGTAGQFLTKASADNYDTQWTTVELPDVNPQIFLLMGS